METVTQFAKESSHWYDKLGNPVNEVPYAKSNKAKIGQFRATNKSDAKKLDLVASVTKMNKILHSEGLERYKINETLTSAYTCPLKRDEVTAKEWIAKVYEDSREHAITTAQQGKEIHADVENFIKNASVKSDNLKRCMNVLEKINEYGISANDIEPEKTFACDLWGGFGGMVDLPAVKKNTIFDVKTKDFTLIDGKPHQQKDDTYEPYKMAYEENILQLTMYAVGLGLIKVLEHLDPDNKKVEFPKLINIYVSRIDDSVYCHEWDEKSIKKALAKAELLVKLWWLDF